MDSFFEIIDFIINDILTQAPIFLGLVALIGLILQRESAQAVMEGTIKTVVGVVILLAGVNLFTSVFLPVMELFQESTGVNGVMPDNSAPFGIILLDFANEVALTFLLGFIVHLLMVKFIPFKNFKNIYLTGHVMLFIAAFNIMTLNWNFQVDGFMLVILGSFLTGLLYTILPAIVRPYTREFNDDEFTLGHQFHGGLIISNYVGKIFKKSKKSDEFELPGILSAFGDYTVLLSIIMPLVFITLGLFIGQEGIQTLSGDNNWIVHLLLNGLEFTAAILIILYGVRTFLGAIIPAFQGISERLLPGTIPALDSPVFYPFAPVASIFGFLSYFGGAIISTLLMILVQSPVIPIPSPIYIFFEGALVGVFGDRLGGWKGAVTAGVLVSMVTHIGVLPLYYLQEPLQGTGVVLGGSEFVFLSVFVYIIEIVIEFFANLF